MATLDTVSAGRFRVACAQLVARDVDESERALAEALEAVDEAARLGAELVVLPEATWPAYVLAPTDPPARLRPDSEVEAAFADAARRHGMHVAVGLGLGFRSQDPAAGSALPEPEALNAALVFGPDGSILLRTAKRFLWDFDRRWFLPGPESPVAAGIGALVCADGRVPEIARLLALRGARLIVDPTAWVTTGRDALALSNPQAEFVMRVRALENGSWIAAANKVGLERGSVRYCGRSLVAGPDGSIVAAAGSRDPEVIVAEIDLDAAGLPPVVRRPGLYGDLLRPPTAALERIMRPLVPEISTLRLGLLQEAAPADQTALSQRVGRLAPVTRALALGLAVATVTTATDQAASDALAPLGAAAIVAEADPDGRVRSCTLAGRTLRPTHGTFAQDPADAARPFGDRLIDIGELRVGVMLGAEGLVPEVARILAIHGAELIVWVADAGTPLVEPVARTRALEERAWLALVVPAAAATPGQAAVFDVDGRPVAAGLDGAEQLVHVVVNAAPARVKEMVPGTDVLRHGLGADLATLVEEPPA